MNTNTAVRQVKDLQVGDKLIGSGAIVVRKPVRGTRTPSGKHEVGILTSGGFVRTATWGSYTKIGVRPAPDCFVLDEKALDSDSQV